MAGRDPRGSTGVTAVDRPVAPEGVRLVLARHGQTPSNIARTLDTVPPGPGLTDEGQRQAQELAAELADEKVVAVLASPARRAGETAEPVAGRHGLEAAVREGTQEVYVGDLEGSGEAESRQLFEEIYASWHFGDLDRTMPGGESGRQALRRFLDAASASLDGVAAGAVVLVSHGAIIRLVAAHLTSIGAARANSAYLPNAGRIVLESDHSEPTGWACLRWDGL